MDTFRDVRDYSLGIIVPVGIILNIVSASVFLRSSLRSTTPGQYFLALALADNMILVGEYMFWMNRFDSSGYRFGMSFMDTLNVMCKGVNFLRYTCRLWSSWIVVAISAERFITVAFPLHVYTFSTIRKARTVIMAELLISAGLSSVSLFVIGLDEYKGNVRCLILKDFSSLYSTWSMACLIAGEMFIPSILVAIFTALIIWKLTRARAARMSSQEGQRESRRRARERQPTINLLAIAITFITIRLPYIVAYQMYMQMNKRDVTNEAEAWEHVRVYAAYCITFVFAVMNYAINFLLYCIFSSNFRSELKRCLGCRSGSREAINSLYGSVYSSYQTQSVRICNLPAGGAVNRVQETALNDCSSYQTQSARICNLPSGGPVNRVQESALNGCKQMSRPGLQGTGRMVFS